MNDVTATPAAPTPVAPPPSVATPPVIERDWTPSDAGRMLAQRRAEKKQQAEPAAPQVAAPEPPAQELAQEANAAPPAEAPSEVPQTPEPAELPPIEPPRSWTKEEKEAFAKWPREAQESVARVTSTREADFRRGQNEAAEIRKAAEAAQKSAEEARKQYEAKLPALMQALHDTSPFADIKSMADVEKLQAEDPFRFQQFQVYQWKMQGVQAELAEAENRKATEHQTKWAEHVQKENALAAEHIPELADSEKAKKLIGRVSDELLPELGFKPDELTELASGKSRLSIYDHRVQRLLADALKLRDIQKASKTVAAQPLPPVQRPGAGKTVVNSNAAQIKALETQLENATGVNQAKIMAQIRQLRKAG